MKNVIIMQALIDSFAQSAACTHLLQQDLAAMGLSITSSQQQQLIAYLALLTKWNRHFNLTAVRDPLQMVSRHLLDSLSIHPYLHGERIIDVGTGAGLPGIPLSILFPEKMFVLLDSNQKKQVFVLQAVNLLSLKNVSCAPSTVQTYQPVQNFSTIVTRAFAPVSEMVVLSAHLLAAQGKFLAMMGKRPLEPVLLPPGYELERLVSLTVPRATGERHLAIIASTGSV